MLLMAITKAAKNEMAMKARWHGERNQSIEKRSVMASSLSENQQSDNNMAAKAYVIITLRIIATASYSARRV